MKNLNLYLLLFFIITSCNPLDNLLRRGSSKKTSRAASTVSEDKVTRYTDPTNSSPVTDFVEAVARTECSDEFDASCISEIIVSDTLRTSEIREKILEDSRPEILAILDKKIRIMRVSESLENDYFEINPTHPFILNPERMINKEEAIPHLGFFTVKAKSGYEYLSSSLPDYVIFHDKIDTDAMKALAGYKEIWVDKNNPNCQPKEIDWSDSTLTKTKLETLSQEYLTEISNPETPACSLNVAIKSFCPQGSKMSYNNPRALKKIIIQIKEGEYEEAGKINLCSGIVIKNYENQNVTLKNPPGENSYLLYGAINERLKIFMNNIHIAGIELDLNTSATGMYFIGNPSGDPSTESFQYRLDGIEVSSPGSIYIKDGYNSEIKNSYFHDGTRSIYVYQNNPNLLIQNNRFENISLQSIFLVPKNKMSESEFNEKSDPQFEDYSYISWNQFYNSAGILGYVVSKLNLSFNYWTENKISQLYNSMGPSINVTISDNLYENNAQIPMYFTSYSGTGFHLKNLEIKNNQVINSPTLESGIANSLVFLEENSSYFNGQCENILIEKNLFLEIGPSVSAIYMPSFCKKTYISRNLFSHSSPSRKATISFGGYFNGADEFVLNENIILGNILIRTNPSSGIGPGDSYEKCKVASDKFSNYCSSTNASSYPFYGTPSECEELVNKRRDLYCIEAIDENLPLIYANLETSQFILKENFIGNYKVFNSTTGKYIDLGTNPSKSIFMDIRAKPTFEGFFEYSEDIGLPDYWNEH